MNRNLLTSSLLAAALVFSSGTGKAQDAPPPPALNTQREAASPDLVGHLASMWSCWL